MSHACRMSRSTRRGRGLSAADWSDAAGHEGHRFRWHTGRVAEHTLMLLRHYKSDCPRDEAELYRRLSKRGRRQAPEAGHWLAPHVDRIDMAVVSTARRARD